MPVVRFSVQAEQDLESIADYIASDNPVRAVSFIQELRDRCLPLSHFPNAYPEYSASCGHFRIMVHGNYIVMYRVEDDAVTIVRIVNGARNLHILW